MTLEEFTNILKNHLVDTKNREAACSLIHDIIPNGVLMISHELRFDTYTTKYKYISIAIRNKNNTIIKHSKLYTISNGNFKIAKPFDKCVDIEECIDIIMNDDKYSVIGGGIGCLKYYSDKSISLLNKREMNKEMRLLTERYIHLKESISSVFESYCLFKNDINIIDIDRGYNTTVCGYGLNISMYLKQERHPGDRWRKITLISKLDHVRGIVSNNYAIKEDDKCASLRVINNKSDKYYEREIFKMYFSEGADIIERKNNTKNV